ncbi:Uncharacterised protein [Campylobacter geochelonis]|nr:Uncharacterised protein [Campylobacter geochelonis]
MLVLIFVKAPVRVVAPLPSKPPVVLPSASFVTVGVVTKPVVGSMFLALPSASTPYNKVAKFSCVLLSWRTFTASVASTPSPTFMIWRSLPFLPTETAP